MALSLQRYTWTNANSRFTQLLKERSRKQREKSMLIPIKNVDHLPENLIIEILSYLPVKDLMQYKTINKSWCAIISSPDFVSKHLKNYYKNNDDWHGCLLVQHYVTHAELQVFELFIDECTGVSLADEVLYNMPLYCSYISGPCDGLYYIYQYGGRALWNPALDEIRYLPKLICKPDLPPTFTYSNYEVYGFGSDPATGDYKVVVIKGYWPTDDDSDAKHPLSVLVYSLRTNLWKYCGDLAKAYDLESNKCYIFVSGCCYWLGSYENTSDVIVCFDMATDAFKEIHVPDYTQPCTKCLALYDDSLAFLSLHDDKNLDIWTLNEGSWTKILSVGPFPDVRGPIGHWKDNRLILQCEDGKLVMLDQNDNQGLKDIGFQHDRWCEGVYAYMESLVSIKDKNESAQPEEVDAEDNQTEEVKVEDKQTKEVEADDEVDVDVSALFE
ncbi:unnamed protein product [Amaranthus hypochondriacus]